MVVQKPLFFFCFYFRPEQHGTDMLGPLSDILNTFSKEEEGPIAAMALEGLYYLCEADVSYVMQM